MHKLLKEHINECDEFEIECLECKEKIKSRDVNSHDKVCFLTYQITQWKMKYEQLEKLNEELEAKLKESEKMNKNIVNLSTKLLENKSVSSNNLSSIITVMLD